MRQAILKARSCEVTHVGVQYGRSDQCGQNDTVGNLLEQRSGRSERGRRDVLTTVPVDDDSNSL
jgi:hypothetical protein